MDMITSFYVFRHIPRKPGEEILNFVNNSAYRLVRAQEENMVLKPWVLLACLLLQNQATGDKRGTSLDELTQRAVWLRGLSRQFGAFLHWPGTGPYVCCSSLLPFLLLMCRLLLIQTTRFPLRWFLPVFLFIEVW